MMIRGGGGSCVAAAVVEGWWAVRTLRELRHREDSRESEIERFWVYVKLKLEGGFGEIVG